MTTPHIHWNPNLHPKYPKGTAGGLGGRFMPVGGTHWSAHVAGQAAPAGQTAAPAPPGGGFVGAVQGAISNPTTVTSGGSTYHVVNGFYFPAGRRVPLTGLTGVALQSALVHNAVQPTGSKLASATMMTKAVQAQKSANPAHGTARQAARAAYSAALAPTPPVAAPSVPTPAAPATPGRAPTIISHTHTLVGTFYFPTGQQVPTAYLSGAKLAAAQKHNAANPGAPMSYGYTPVAQKVLASQRFSRPPQGLTQVQGYLFPTGAQVPLKGLVGVRKNAAIAHNAAVASGVPAPAHPQMNLTPHVIATPKATVASSTHVPVVGSDVRASLDYKALHATVTGTGVSRSSRGTQFGSTGDAALWDIYTVQGYHGAPEVVSRAEMDKRLANGEGWVELFRGNHDYIGSTYTGAPPSKTKKQIRQEFATGQHHYAGYGMYGNGTYAGDIQTVSGSYTTRDTAYTGPGAIQSSWSTYGGPAPAAAFQGGSNKNPPDLSHPYWDMTDGGWSGLIRMGLRPDARVIDHRALLTLRTRLQASSPANMQTVFNDEGRFAAALGYDAIRVKQTGSSGGTPYHVILNRSALMVEKPPK